MRLHPKQRSRGRCLPLALLVVVIGTGSLLEARQRTAGHVNDPSSSKPVDIVEAMRFIRGYMELLRHAVEPAPDGARELANYERRVALQPTCLEQRAIRSLADLQPNALRAIAWVHIGALGDHLANGQIDLARHSLVMIEEALRLDVEAGPSPLPSALAARGLVAAAAVAWPHRSRELLELLDGPITAGRRWWPDDPVMLALAAHQELKLGRWSEASRDVERWREAQPDDELAMLTGAVVQLRSGTDPSPVRDLEHLATAAREAWVRNLAQSLRMRARRVTAERSPSSLDGLTATDTLASDFDQRLHLLAFGSTATPDAPARAEALLATASPLTDPSPRAFFDAGPREALATAASAFGQVAVDAYPLADEALRQWFERPAALGAGSHSCRDREGRP